MTSMRSSASASRSSLRRRSSSPAKKPWRAWRSSRWLTTYRVRRRSRPLASHSGTNGPEGATTRMCEPAPIARGATNRREETEAELSASMLAWLAAHEGPFAYVAFGLASMLEYVVPPLPGDAIALFGIFLCASAGWSTAGVYLALNAGSLVGGMIAYAGG